MVPGVHEDPGVTPVGTVCDLPRRPDVTDRCPGHRLQRDVKPVVGGTVAQARELLRGLIQLDHIPEVGRHQCLRPQRPTRLEILGLGEDLVQKGGLINRGWREPVTDRFYLGQDKAVVIQHGPDIGVGQPLAGAGPAQRTAEDRDPVETRRRGRGDDIAETQRRHRDIAEYELAVRGCGNGGPLPGHRPASTSA